MVLYTNELKVSRSLAKNLRNKGYEVKVDTAFREVIKGCASRKETWLSRPMQAAYFALHQSGYAHSFETWQGDDLVGGLYGVAVGRMFYGESMFSARHRRLQGGARRPGAAARSPGFPPHRLPDEDAAAGLARRPRDPPCGFLAGPVGVGKLRGR
jgi:hypothetical protein